VKKNLNAVELDKGGCLHKNLTIPQSVKRLFSWLISVKVFFKLRTNPNNPISRKEATHQ